MEQAYDEVPPCGNEGRRVILVLAGICISITGRSLTIGDITKMQGITWTGCYVREGRTLTESAMHGEAAAVHV
jgi:hypothetical protein